MKVLFVIVIAYIILQTVGIVIYVIKPTPIILLGSFCDTVSEFCVDSIELPDFKYTLSYEAYVKSLQSFISPTLSSLFVSHTLMLDAQYTIRCEMSMDKIDSYFTYELHECALVQ